MQILRRFDVEAPSIAPAAEEQFTNRFLRVLDYIDSISEIRMTALHFMILMVDASTLSENL